MNAKFAQIRAETLKLFQWLVLLTVLLITANNAHAGQCLIPEEKGNWGNYDVNTRSITQLHFDMECRDATTQTCSGGVCTIRHAVKAHYFIRLFGSCHPTDCDWGTVEGTGLTGNLAGWYYFHYDHGFAKRHVYARTYPEWPGWLRLWMRTDFSDPSRADYIIDEWFVR